MQKIDHIDDLLEGKLGETERRVQTFPLCLCSVPNADITCSKWKFYFLNDLLKESFRVRGRE